MIARVAVPMTTSVSAWRAARALRLRSTAERPEVEVVGRAPQYPQSGSGPNRSEGADLRPSGAGRNADGRAYLSGWRKGQVRTLDLLSATEHALGQRRALVEITADGMGEARVVSSLIAERARSREGRLRVVVPVTPRRQRPPRASCNVTSRARRSSAPVPASKWREGRATACHHCVDPPANRTASDGPSPRSRRRPGA